MNPHIIADLLERAMATDIGIEACVASQGSTPLQEDLHRKASSALRRHGVAQPMKASMEELSATATALRAGQVRTHTPPSELSRIFGSAAQWLAAAPSYGPANYRVGNDIVEAIERHASGQALYDALTVIAESVPAVTITDWEWNVAKRRADKAIKLLRRLAKKPKAPGERIHPDTPARVGITADLTDIHLR
jgi:hypothetical protein